jgi:hypothetical protein
MIMLGKYENGFTMIKQSLKFQNTISACAKLGFTLYYYKNKNYQQSIKWLNLLPPFEIPFSNLLKIAIEGKLNGKVVSMDCKTVNGHEKNIVDRIVLDPRLRNQITDGWKLAGLLPVAS